MNTRDFDSINTTVNKGTKYANNTLCNDEVITQDNASRIGERIALGALKTILNHSYNRKLNKLYMGLSEDVANVNNPGHVFSNGYDLAQSAACFLCEYMGKPLNEVCAYTVRGKLTTILDACFSKINKMLMGERKESFIFESNDSLEVINLSVPFQVEVEQEEDCTVVDETISKLHLSDGEIDVLNCYLAGMGFEQTVAYLSVAVITVWSRRKRIQRKFNFIIGTDD